MRAESAGSGAMCLSIAGIIFVAAAAVAAADTPLPSRQVQHPALAGTGAGGDAAAQAERVARVMALSEDELQRYVPDWGYASYCECPACYGGVEGNQIFTWTPDRPDELKCRFCSTLVRPNPQYPEDQTLVGRNGLGEEVRLPYYHNREKDIRHFLTLNLGLYRRRWLETQCEALGRAYLATGKEEYARRVVLVLQRVAERYPHYPVLQNLPRRLTFRESQSAPWPWDSGRWAYFHNEIPTGLTVAYDLVYHSPEFDRRGAALGHDLRARIENDFFRATFAAVEQRQEHVNNCVGYDVAAAARLGQVLNEPRYVHWAFRWMLENLYQGFMADGMWHESPAYHRMTIGGLRQAFAAVRGYSDPPGYRDPVDGERFDALDPDRLPVWSLVQGAPDVIAMPDGTDACVHDTHPYARSSPRRETSISSFLPAFGQASLGRGHGADQMLAQLHFSGGYGHAHYDNLNLTLWAKERDLAPDLGYTWTQMRTWTTSTLAHNLVVVDRLDQDMRDSDGDLRCAFPNTAGIAVVEADGRRAYRRIKGLDGYRRLLLLVPVSAADAYVVDLFRVRGGSRHDWTLNGDADRDSVAACSAPLSGNRKWLLEGDEPWTEPTLEGAAHHPYGMVRDLRNGSASGPFQVTFTAVDDPTCGLRIHAAGAEPVDIWLGRAPSVRRMGQGSSGDMRKGYDFWMPKLVLRRTGETPLSSLFAMVEEPFRGAPFLGSVETLPLTPAAAGAVALCIRHGNSCDTIVSTVDDPPYPERRTATGIRLRGRLGVVRETAGKVAGMWLFEGLHLAADGQDLSAVAARYAGTLDAACRRADGAAVDAFETTAALPAGEILAGAWMLVTHGNGSVHGYPIARVEASPGRTRIVLAQDHGLRLVGDTTREVFFPRREIAGPNTFVIPTSATSVSTP